MNRPYSVTLTCRAAAHRVGRHLTAVHTAAARHARISSRLVITNDHHTLAEAARSATELLIMDGHGYNHPEPRIGTLPLARLRSPAAGLRAAGVVLGCCDGAGEPFPAALRAVFDRPAAVLACAGRADYDDAEMLYPTVLDTLQSIAPADVTPSVMAEILELALNTVAAHWPGHNWGRWSVLRPAEACRPVAWTRG